MYVNNLRLYARHLRRDLAESPSGLPDAAHARFLLQGPNGSGKSTILEAIAMLWDFFGEWIDAGPGRGISGRSRCFKHYFADCDLAAVELQGLLPEGKPLWLGMGKVKYWVDLKVEHPQAEFAGLVQSKGSWEVQLPPGDWTTFRHKSLVGSEPQPNVVFFEPELRSLAFIRGKAPHLIDLMPYQWLAYFNANVDLESLLLTIKAGSQQKYDDALQFVNQALDNQRKELVLGSQGFKVHGRTEFGVSYEHSINELSSGEKQMLLLIGFVAAVLRPGGIVIIDEPDLHIHITMIPQLLASIEAIVKARNGQMIVAAHSQEVWDWFSLSTERVQLAPWRTAP
jgi:energy-coupling factor transporter ATP-binding protein EcfA2